MPILALLISRHVSLFSKGIAIDESQLTTAKDTIQNLETVFSDRIFDLHNIWRRQRIDVDTQFKYYANGLFEDYFKVGLGRYRTLADIANATNKRQTGNVSIPMSKMSKANGTQTTNGILATIRQAATRTQRQQTRLPPQRHRPRRLHEASHNRGRLPRLLLSELQAAVTRLLLPLQPQHPHRGSPSRQDRIAEVLQLQKNRVNFREVLGTRRR